MIEMSYREFQRGFCKVKDMNEEIRVIGKHGVVIGTWRSGCLTNEVGHAEENENYGVRIMAKEGLSDRKSVLNPQIMSDKIDIIGQGVKLPLRQTSEKREKLNSLKKLFDEGKPLSEIQNNIAEASGQKSKSPLQQTNEDGLPSGSCHKCGKQAFKQPLLENEGGEWENMWVCPVCIKKNKIKV